MGPSDAITYGLLAAPTIAGAIGLFYLPFWIAEKRKEWKATTPEQKEALITEKLAEGYAEEGHSDPWRAAHEHKAVLRHIERFRIYACQKYVLGREMDDIRKDWWKREKTTIEGCMAIGADKATGIRCANVIKHSVMEMDDSKILIHEPAKSERMKRQKLINEEADRILKSFERDAVMDSVVESLWEIRRHPCHLMGK